MTRLGLQLCTIALCLLTTVTRGFGQEEPKTETAPAAQPAAAAQPAPAVGATHKVKQEPFKIEVDMSGVFEADQTWPVTLSPNSWSSFTVLKAVPHGKPVQKGETLVWLDMKEIDEQLQDMEKSLRLNKLVLQLADTELELMKTTLPLDLEASARAKKITDEDLNYFLNINRSFMEESASFSLKSSQQSLEYAEEELKQLEKMYTADDLTEETEEIVLKRARNEVEQGKFYLKSTELRTKKTVEQELPRLEQQLTEAAKRAEIGLEKSRATLPVQFEKQQIERDKQVVDNLRAEKKLQDLMADRKSMAVESPAEGYVYYGRCTRGKWPGVDAMAGQLQEGGKLPPDSVFMTIVSPRPLRVRADVAEKDLHRLAKGMPGTAVPAGYPDMKLPITVEHVSPFPIGPGTFDGYVRVTLDEKAKPVVPGMACKLTLIAYEKKDAITVPAAAVFDNPADGERNLVYVKTAEDKSAERKVVIGQKTEQTWEILQGLNPGEEILLKKPETP
jgi:HlyD family secretion protein